MRKMWVVLRALKPYTARATVINALFFYLKFTSSRVPENAGALSCIEFAVRATRGNKALRTNNAGYCMVAVEPLPHPTTVGKFYSLTRDHTMKTHTKNNRTLAARPTLSVSAAQGGIYA